MSASLPVSKSRIAAGSEALDRLTEPAGRSTPMATREVAAYSMPFYFALQRDLPARPETPGSLLIPYGVRGQLVSIVVPHQP